MSPQNIVLLVAGLLNLIMSIFIISRGWKNKINLYFSLLTFFNFLWASGLIVINLGVNYEITRFFASFIYPVALMVVVSLFYFIIYFPYKTFELPKFYRIIITLFVVGFTIFCLIFYKIFVTSVDLSSGVIIYYEIWSYLIYSIVLISLMLKGIAILFIKYKKSEGVFKTQLGLIILAVLVGTITGSYFNLFKMYFYDLNYNYLGPLFTLAINFIVFYLIFLSKLNISQK